MALRVDVTLALEGQFFAVMVHALDLAVVEKGERNVLRCLVNTRIATSHSLTEFIARQNALKVNNGST